MKKNNQFCSRKTLFLENYDVFFGILRENMLFCFNSNWILQVWFTDSMHTFWSRWKLYWRRKVKTYL